GWGAAVGKQIQENEPPHHGAYYESVGRGFVVATGAVFREDQVLHPNELVSTSVVFYVPQDMYDMLYVHVELPTVGVFDSAEVELNWEVAADQGCSSKKYRKRNGVRAEEITERDYMLHF